MILVVGHSKTLLQSKPVKSIWYCQDFYADRKHIHTHIDWRLSLSQCKFQLVKTPTTKKNPLHVCLLLVDERLAFLSYGGWEGKEGMIDQPMLYDCLCLVFSRLKSRLKNIVGALISFYELYLNKLIKLPKIIEGLGSLSFKITLKPTIKIKGLGRFLKICTWHINVLEHCLYYGTFVLRWILPSCNYVIFLLTTLW